MSTTTAASGRIPGFIQSTEAIAKRTGGYQTLSLLVMSVINFAENFCTLPVGLVNLNESMSHFDQATSIPSLLNRTVKWMESDARGKNVMLQQPVYSSIGYAGLTTFSVLKFVKYLNSLKIVQISATALKNVTNIQFIGLVVFAVCNLWDLVFGKGRTEHAKKLIKYSATRVNWEVNLTTAYLSVEQWKNLASQRVNALLDKLTACDFDKNAKILKKIQKWEQLKECDLKSAQAYCQAKISKWEVGIKEEVKDRRISIISSIALAVLMSGLLGVISLSPIKIGLADLAVSTLDVWSTHRGNCQMIKEVDLPLPETKPQEKKDN